MLQNFLLSLGPLPLCCILLCFQCLHWSDPELCLSSYSSLAPLKSLSSHMALNATQMAFVTFKCVSPAPSSPLSYTSHSTVICCLQLSIMQYWIISLTPNTECISKSSLLHFQIYPESCFPFCHHYNPNLSYSPLPNSGPSFTLNPYNPVSSHRVTF